MLLALLIQAADPAALIAAEKLRTAAEQRCVVDPDSTDVTVCGLRRADRFRVPFASPSTIRQDDVVAERGELLRRNTPIQDMGPFLVGGGEMGVKVGVGLGIDVGGGKTTVGGLRQPAP